MKFYKQRHHHNPEEGIFGDCFRTALACLLDMVPEQVPHFMQGIQSTDEFESVEIKRAIDDWLALRNLTKIDIPYHIPGAPPTALMEHLGNRDGEDMCYLLTGRSRSAIHVVICRGSKFLWDPSPTNIGIISPIKDLYWITYLVPLFMRYNG